MMVLSVDQLERFIMGVASFYSDVETGKSNADRWAYTKYYTSIMEYLRMFIGDYQKSVQ